jgi:hypothetical protein
MLSTRTAAFTRSQTYLFAGSAVFATGRSSNPTLMIVAIALHLADHIKNQ